MDLDVQLFYLINHATHTRWLDTFMLLVSQMVLPLSIIFFLVLAALALRGKKDFREVVFLGLAFGLGLLVNSVLLKDAFARPRPDQNLSGVIIVGQPNDDYSFPSGHSFTIALLAVLVARKKDILMAFFIPFALLTGLSRIYLGVHYPSDVLVGLGLGFLYGLIINGVVDEFIEHPVFKILKFHLE